MNPKSVELTHLLSQQYLCESLTIKEVQCLLEYTEIEEFDSDAIIAEIGEVGQSLFFLIEGEVSLSYEEGGQESEMGRMVSGELAGVMSFFDQEPRLLRMRATRNETRLLKLTRARYDRLRVEHPYIAVNLLEHAIVSLDHLVRRVSHEGATLSRYLFGQGKR